MFKPSYKPSVLIVDGAHCLRRACYQPSYRELSNSRGMPTGAVYGVCKILASLGSRFSANSVLVSLEGGHSVRRKSLYEDYKKRDGNDEPEKDTGMTDLEYYLHQQSWARKLLESVGIRVVSVSGKEGDDTIFQLSHLVDGDVTIVSEDKDFFTLVSEKISVYRPIKDESVSLENFSEVTGSPTPLHYLYTKVLLGDGSDNIPSVCKGVGEKTVSDILNSINVEELSLKKIREVAATYKGTRYQKVALLPEDTFNRNMNLVDISKEQFSVPEVLGIVSTLKEVRYDLEGALKIMKVLEFGESVKTELLSLGERCRNFPLSVLDKEYIRTLIEGSGSNLLGG